MGNFLGIVILNRKKAANKCFSLFKSQHTQQKVVIAFSEKDKKIKLKSADGCTVSA